MRCAGCGRKLEVGDRYIEDTASGFTGGQEDIETDSLVAEFLGGVGEKIFFCEDCTEAGGKYLFDTYYGDEDDE